MTRYLLISLLMFVLSSCYYDNEEELYQFLRPPICQTDTLSYQRDIHPIWENNCFQCHGQGLAFGNINLSGYEDVLVLAKNGRLLGAISHDPAFSPMPKGGNQLDSCQIKRVEAWMSQGMINN